MADISVFRPTALTTLTGLGSLSDIRQHLSIRDNPALESLAAMSAPAKVGGVVQIKDPESLDQNTVTQLLSVFAVGSDYEGSGVCTADRGATSR